MGKAKGVVDLIMSRASGRIPILKPNIEKGSPWPEGQVMFMCPIVIIGY